MQLLLDLIHQLTDLRTLAGLIIGAAIAGLASSWLARAAERRKAYAEVVGAIRERLLNYNGDGSPDWPRAHEIDRLRVLMSGRRFRRLQAAVDKAKARYERQRSTDRNADWTGLRHTDIPLIDLAIADLLASLPRR